MLRILFHNLNTFWERISNTATNFYFSSPLHESIFQQTGLPVSPTELKT